jgi:hypothetical protein
MRLTVVKKCLLLRTRGELWGELCGEYSCPMFEYNEHRWLNIRLF